jgi:ribosomal protein S18 acetylase RimI-like enzyme
VDKSIQVKESTKVIVELEKELSKRNITEYCLQVFSDNPAVKLYEKLDFQTIGTIKRLDKNKVSYEKSDKLNESVIESRTN